MNPSQPYATDGTPLQEYDPNKCPECGVSLDGLSREGHAGAHFPTRWPTKDNRNLLARQRQAALLQRSIPLE